MCWLLGWWNLYQQWYRTTCCRNFLLYTSYVYTFFFFTFNQFSPLFLGHWMHVSFSIGFLFLCLSLVLIWSLTHCLDISRLTKKCLLLSFVATFWLLIYTINAYLSWFRCFINTHHGILLSQYKNSLIILMVISMH